MNIFFFKFFIINGNDSTHYYCYNNIYIECDAYRLQGQHIIPLLTVCSLNYLRISLEEEM